MKKYSGLKNIRWGLLHTSQGWWGVVWSIKGLSAMSLPQKNKPQAFKSLKKHLPQFALKFWKNSPSVVPKVIQDQIQKIFTSMGFHFNQFDLSFLTSFQQSVLKATFEIPRGQYRTYGWIARKIGSPKGFRAVGQALNCNPIPIFIPCHRVIAGHHRIGGYGGGLRWKIKLMKTEGITVKQGIVR